jgi:hypothetical protein
MCFRGVLWRLRRLGRVGIDDQAGNCPTAHGPTWATAMDRAY